MFMTYKLALSGKAKISFYYGICHWKIKLKMHCVANKLPNASYASNYYHEQVLSLDSTRWWYFITNTIHCK